MKIDVKERKSKYWHSVIYYKHFNRTKTNEMVCYSKYLNDEKVESFKILGYQLPLLKDMNNLYNEHLNKKIQKIDYKLLFNILFYINIGYNKPILLINECNKSFDVMKTHIKRLVALKLIKYECSKQLILRKKGIKALENGCYSITFYS